MKKSFFFFKWKYYLLRNCPLLKVFILFIFKSFWLILWMKRATMIRMRRWWLWLVQLCNWLNEKRCSYWNGWIEAIWAPSSPPSPKFIVGICRFTSSFPLVFSDILRCYWIGANSTNNRLSKSLTLCIFTNWIEANE